MNWVWLKRDLRLQDHEPFFRASKAEGELRALFVLEPSMLQAPDMDAQHWNWIAASLRELGSSLAALGIPLEIRKGDMLEVCADLLAEDPDFRLWSHMETGTERGFARDRALKQWMRNAGCSWVECPQQAVLRGLQDRDRWHPAWEDFMAQSLWGMPEAQGEPLAPFPEDAIPSAEALGIPAYHPAVPERQNDVRPGRAEAQRMLKSFLMERGRAYHREMSSPVSAWSSCSRLSPYLAWGNLSIREVLQRTRAAQAWHREGKKGGQPGAFPGAALSAFESRLHWHCHFIQKLESEPAIEFHCFHSGFDALREKPREDWLEAWMAGQTGYPMVDACMRALQCRGWINFRMRAMLVSFAAYDLWLDWRLFRDRLAQQFLDYEPGIHISQLQMQSGVTGINTLRMYNPIKQGQDHDPEGRFLRLWLPELAELPADLLHEPWKATEAQRRGYPLPIVDHLEACREARKRFSALRKDPRIQAEAHEVQAKHGSRTFRRVSLRRPRKKKAKPAEDLQLPLEGI